MKRLCAIVAVLIVLAGCASSKSATKTETPAVPKAPQSLEELKLKAGMESLRAGIEARGLGKDEEAMAAFRLARKYLDDIDAPARNILADGAEDLRRIISIAGFAYAPKESMELLVVYLEMQNAYAINDTETLKKLKTLFDERSDRAKDAIAMAKQKRLEMLGQEVSAKKEEIKRQVEPEPTAPTYPSVYIVKRGDTLPGIAARHDIYNDSFLWPLIYKANRDQIKDPKILYTGQDLKIPRDVSMEDIVQARREAGAPEPDKIPKDALLPRRTK